MSASTPDPLVVGLIRTLNGGFIARHMSDASDLDLASAFGQAAQPLADALRVEVAAEVARQLEGRSS